MSATAATPTLWTGALAGYAASRTMDAATSWYHPRQSAASREREEELAPGGTLVQLGLQLGKAMGRDLDIETAGKVGLTAHRTLGCVYGMLAAALVRRGWSPLVTGPVVGAAALIVIDEGTALPQFFDYPWESHLRGVIGHTTLGCALGVLLWLADRGAR